MKKVVWTVLMLAPASLFASTDVGDIVTGATSTFASVATLCVAIGVFFIGYRIARKVR